MLDRNEERFQRVPRVGPRVVNDLARVECYEGARENAAFASKQASTLLGRAFDNGFGVRRGAGGGDTSGDVEAARGHVPAA